MLNCCFDRSTWRRLLWNRAHSRRRKDQKYLVVLSGIQLTTSSRLSVIDVSRGNHYSATEQRPDSRSIFDPLHRWVRAITCHIRFSFISSWSSEFVEHRACGCVCGGGVSGGRGGSFGCSLVVGPRCLLIMRTVAIVISYRYIEQGFSSKVCMAWSCTIPGPILVKTIVATN